MVQDLAEAVCPSMPANAMAGTHVDHVLTVAEMPAVLVQLTGQQTEKGEPAMRPQKARQPDIAEAGDLVVNDQFLKGSPSGFVCPECGGALWEVEDGKMLSYRCHVGHRYNGDGLVAQQSEALESALWTALRTLEENAALNRRFAQRMRQRDANLVAKAFEERALDSEQRATTIRDVLLKELPPVSDERKKRARARPPSALARKVLGRKRK
jgi:two-component system chemotaxis response regulator CheB